MQHEATALSDADRQRYAAVVEALANPRPMHVISVALKTTAPPHMIDTQLPNLWRY